MANPYLGQIQAFGFNFAPRGWARCEGQLLQISQNTALFSLLGTTYGGDGRTTFGLPDLRGRASMSYGRGPGLTNRRIGEKGGQEGVVLTTGQIPGHNHAAFGSNEEADSTSPAGRVPATGASAIYNATVDSPFNANDVKPTGGGGAHNNMQPYLVVNWCISLTGTYPPRS